MGHKNPIWELFWENGTKYNGDNSHKAALCKACLEVCEARLRQEEVVAVSRGGQVPPEKSPEQWRSAASNQVTAMVINGSEEKKAKRDGVVVRSDAATNAAKRSRTASAPQPSSSHAPSPSFHFPPLPQQSSRFDSPSGSLSPLPGFTNLPAFSTDRSFSPGPSFAPSPSPSVHDPDSPQLKRRRTSYAQNSASIWTAEQQAEFGEDLLDLVVACGWSFNIINSPEFRLFFGKYLPAAKLPDRRVLSGPILTSRANQVIAKTRLKIQGKLATYNEDGWKNIAHTHVDTSMLSVEGEPYLLRTHDMTGRPKTGDELFEIMKSDFEYAWNTYQVEIIAVCTDDGPDGKKARRLVHEWKPSIAVFCCWAHQSSLMTGNYLAIKAVWMADAKEALEVVKWFNNHGKALDLLTTQQTLVFSKVLRLILPVVTRWTIHYCCLRRIKKLERAIRTCVITHEKTLERCAGNKPEQIAAAQVIIETCKRDSFWKNISRIVGHLEPLAISANILQSPHCRLDTVLLTLANLFRIFNNLPSHDAIVKKTLHDSLERRWGKADQQLMILGVFFNPYVRARSFNREELNANTMFHLVRRAFERLLGQDAVGDIDFSDTFRAYYDSMGEFSDEAMCLQEFADSYSRAKKPIDLVFVWKQMDGTLLTGRSGFVKLAIRILSILPNSAGPERAFSVFGLTHTKHRNRLDPLKVHDATLVRMDRQKAHIAAGLVPERKSRRFSLADDEREDSAAGAALDPSDFDAMANELIRLANDEGDDEDDAPPAPPPAPSVAVPPPPTPLASTTVPNARGRIPAYKKIKLAKLFTYPPPGQLATEFEFFWQGGVDGVEAEEDALAEARGNEAEDVVEGTQSVLEGQDSQVSDAMQIT
ncbi:hypothetical protein MVEN_00039600 [Mycena venus]|uniref:HAT C-terminal dimerisation domain-containing protein n=1 Tax=Mycena venus TaxID=2733690 RepID=A0A8H6Z3U5_9AGAR|nr:hypothetical protein MVEN_00039600 [Mycena venus]